MLGYVMGPRPGPEVDLANGEESWRYGHPAGSATASARGIAGLFAAAVTGRDGAPPLLTADTVFAVGQQQVRGTDEVLGLPDRAHGVVFQKASQALAWGGPRSFGHDGAAGAVGCVDPDTGVAFGYTIARGPWPGGATPGPRRRPRASGVCAGRGTPGTVRRTGDVTRARCPDRVRITWNVNSVMQRVPRLLPLVGAVRRGVPAETAHRRRLRRPARPGSPRGYDYAAHGQGQWNGVALCPGGARRVRPASRNREARAVTRRARVRVHSLYVPNGRVVGSALPQTGVARRAARSRGGLTEPSSCAATSTSPTDADVFDPHAYRDETHVTVPERAALAALQDLGLRDVVRDRWPGERVFSYWDYRAGMFHQNLGMRIDLVLAGAPVAARVVAAWIDREARKGTAPSDHAPVVVDLDDAPDGDIGRWSAAVGRRSATRPDPVAAGQGLTLGVGTEPGAGRAQSRLVGSEAPRRPGAASSRPARRARAPPPDHAVPSARPAPPCRW
jgi:exodeoxyribonuclease-3